MAGSASVYLTKRGDDVALMRQQREAQAAVTRNILKLPKEQETIAIWDDPILRIQRRVPDTDWLHQNIGAWLNTNFGHDEVYILDGHDRPIYALAGGNERAATR